MAYTLSVRWAILIAIVTFGVASSGAAARSTPCERVATSPPPQAAAARSHVHSVQITVPAQLDFTLASMTLGGSAAGVHVTTAGPTAFQYVAAAALCDAPHRVFILVVNRLPRGSLTPTPASITLRIETRNATSAPAIVQRIDVLADGAPGQDCSALMYYPALGHPYIWGYKLKPLAGPGGSFVIRERVADALNQACSDSIDTRFERWVRQEPSDIVHP